jgi:GNAT superfamily N-acetyltransferase
VKTLRVEVRPVTTASLPDLERLFGGSKTLSGCWCMWFLLSNKECETAWGQGNQASFGKLVEQEHEPMGLLAYHDGEPVGWCATGPRSRYGRALRSPLLAERDPGEDDRTWFVPCLFVRRDVRGSGVTGDLLAAAVQLATEHGAVAIEGFPLIGGVRHPTAEAYVGTEAMFASNGFHARDRPSPRRIVMRRDLTALTT